MTGNDAELEIREADRLEVTILVDNYTDVLMLQGTEVVKRPMTPPPNLPWAEHGFSCLLKVYSGTEEHTVLMDAGVTYACLQHNADVLRQNLSKVETVVLSHGHFDHFGGLLEFLDNSRDRIPLVLHPDAFSERRLNIPNIGISEMPSLSERALADLGTEVIKREEASTVAGDLIMVSGEVERATGFEKGFPWAEARIDGKWSVDPFCDDQAIAVNVKDKGLVVVSGCAHAGIINTVRHAQKMAGTKKVHAVMGGFHLTGGLFNPIIPSTIEGMKDSGPDFVVPMHCTGWNAIQQFAREMPRQFLLNTVGTTYVFG